MPAMPRLKDKVLRIVFKLLGRSPKEPKQSDAQAKIKNRPFIGDYNPKDKY